MGEQSQPGFEAVRYRRLADLASIGLLGLAAAVLAGAVADRSFRVIALALLGVGGLSGLLWLRRPRGSPAFWSQGLRCRFP